MQQHRPSLPAWTVVVQHNSVYVLCSRIPGYSCLMMWHAPPQQQSQCNKRDDSAAFTGHASMLGQSTDLLHKYKLCWHVCRLKACQVSPRGQQASPQVAAAAGSHISTAALYSCTMERLPPGGTALNAFNACTMEQLPSGRTPPPPASAQASPVLPGVSSPATVPAMGQEQCGAVRPQQQGHEGRPRADERQGSGQARGLLGARLFARNAAAALCSARQHIAEPRNLYRLVIAGIVNAGMEHRARPFS